MAGEIDGLVDFVYKLSTRQFGEEIPLRYSRAFIRIGVIIVAKTQKILHGIEPYVRAMEYNLKKELYSVYVLVFDKDWLGEQNPDTHEQFMDQVKKLTEQLETATIAIKTHDTEYTCLDRNGRRDTARLIRFEMPTEQR